MSLALIIRLALVPVLTAGGEPPEAVIEFFVTAPADTAPGDALYLAGNARALGGWSPAGVALKRLEDGRFYGRIGIPCGTDLEFKVTRGSWAGVERDRDGQDIPNRKLKVDKDAKVEIGVASWKAAVPPARRSTITGQVRLHPDFSSRHLGNRRTLAVYLPPGYRDDGEDRFPVLYLHDGQNVFDAATAAFGVEWQADEAAERLISAGRLRPLLMVAIYNNADRMEEYTPWRDARWGRGGRGDLYARFLVEEVKPFIDRTYRTLPGRETTAVAGSSLGGLISLHLAGSRRETFGLCAALSPALQWADGALLREWPESASHLRSTRLWIDMGSAETSGEAAGVPQPIRNTRALAEILDRAGLSPGRDYYYFEATGAAHNEAAWAQRFDKVLLYLFGN